MRRDGGTWINYDIDTASNRVRRNVADPPNIFYDAAGNMTHVGSNIVMQYDALNMQTVFQGGSGGPHYYFYGPGNVRLMTLKGSNGERTFQFRGLNNEILREYVATGYGAPGEMWSFKRDYVHGPTGVIASRSASGIVYYYHPDHLGTTRLITGIGGNPRGVHNFYPYGLEIPLANQVDDLNVKFTGHQRDPHGLTDYMLGRTNVYPLMRFASVDPGRDGWNLYAYGQNNPVKYLDPDGREAILAIVEPSNSEDNKKGALGHAALYVTSDGGNAGVSVYGGYDFRKGLEGFISGYAKENRSARLFLLETTPEQDRKMVEFINSDSSAGVDEEGSIASENCTTGVCNTLKAGGVLEKGSAVGNLGGLVYSPKLLELSISHGKLKIRQEIFNGVEFKAQNDGQKERQ